MQKARTNNTIFIDRQHLRGQPASWHAAKTPPGTTARYHGALPRRPRYLRKLGCHFESAASWKEAGRQCSEARFIMSPDDNIRTGRLPGQADVFTVTAPIDLSSSMSTIPYAARSPACSGQMIEETNLKTHIKQPKEIAQYTGGICYVGPVP